MLFVLQIESTDPLQDKIVQTRKYYIKHWMRYVHKFIESSGFNNSWISTFPLVHILQFLQHQIQVGNIMADHSLIFIYDVEYLKHNVTYILYRFKGSGQLIYYPLFKLFKPSLQVTHRIWYFTFIAELRLRILIHRLRVHEMYGSCNQNVTISNEENITENGFIFCGDYSEFYCYPSQMQVYFSLFYGSAPYFYLDITFDIISADIIKNYVFPTQCNIKYRIMYNIKISSLFLFIYYVNISKFQQLYIRTNTLMKGVLFNGPGYLSKVKTIVSNVSTYAISGFQCILKFEYHSFRLQNDNCTVRYSGITRYSKISLLGNATQTFQYNSTHNLSAYPYTLMLKSQTKNKILVTIFDFSFNATEDDVDCKYGGVSFFDVEGNDMHETILVCTTREEDQQNLQPYYSAHNTTIVVMYYYAEYSSLSLLLHVSVTHCYAVKINVCAISLACRSSVKQCLTIWENELIKVSKTVYLTIYPGNRNCTVLQFLNNSLYKFPFSALMKVTSFTCELNFYMNNLTDPVIYQYDISGYLSNFDKYRTRAIYYQSFSAFGFAYQNDPRHSISQKNRIRCFNYDENGILLFVHDEHGANIPIKATLQEVVQPDKNAIRFRIKLIKWIS